MCVGKCLSALRDLAFIAEYDGSEQRYMQLLPEPFDVSEVHHLLIALHGHGSDRRQYATDPRDECRAARDVAARAGMLFVSPDYRAPASWMGPAAEADLLQLIALLKQQYRIDRVFLVGGSMGGTSALTFTALHPELIAGVSAQNPLADHLTFENFQDTIADSFGGTKVAIHDEYRKRSALYHPDAFTMPVAITTGGLDTTVPPHSALQLAQRLQELHRPILLIHRDEVGHATDYADTLRAVEYACEVQ